MTTDSRKEEVHDSRGWMEDPKDRDLLISLEHGLLLRVKVAAILLGIGRTTMYELIRRGQIAVVRIGRRTLIHRNDLEEFAQQRRNKQGDAGHAR
jgi:excisionase family DNA binding protein